MAGVVGAGFLFPILVVYGLFLPFGFRLVAGSSLGVWQSLLVGVWQFFLISACRLLVCLYSYICNPLHAARRAWQRFRRCLVGFSRYGAGGLKPVCRLEFD